MQEKQEAENPRYERLGHDLASTFTSCTLRSVMCTNGILPRMSSSVRILTAALRRRSRAHGNSARHRSMVVESRGVQVLFQIDAHRVASV